MAVGCWLLAIGCCLKDRLDVIATVYFLLLQIGLALYKSEEIEAVYFFVIGRGVAGFFVGGLLARLLLKRERLNEKKRKKDDELYRRNDCGSKSCILS